MEFDPGTLEPPARYRLLIGTILPRPIAWISSVSAEGVANLAPYSFFAGVTAHPPTLVVGVAKRRGVVKDTARNLLETGEAVVHIAHRALAEAMVATSADVAPEVDEFDLAKLPRAPARHVRPVRLADARIAFECRVVNHLEVGSQAADVFFLEAVWIHVADEILAGDLPDPTKLDAVGRLGGAEYCAVADIFSIPRPKP